MLTGVAVRLGGEALKGCEHTVAVWPWGWGGQGCWARDGGVARPRPMEHDAQPYECDQRELVEEKMRYHGKPPHTRAEMRVFTRFVRLLNYPHATGTRPDMCGRPWL